MEKETGYVHDYVNQTEAQIGLACCRYKFALSYLERDLVEDDNLFWLDVGSNIGKGFPSYIPDNITLLSSDLDKQYLELQENQFPKVNLDAANIPFQNNCCDVVSCFETIEHIELKKVYKLLPELNRVLKNDGLLFLSTPNKDVNGRRKMSSDHKQEFSKVELVGILDKFGFEVIEGLGQNIVRDKNILHQMFLSFRQNVIISKLYDSMPSFLVNFVRNESINAFGDGEIREIKENEAERIIYLLCRKKT
jgi:SAM-dependent methyltransferase